VQQRQDKAAIALLKKRVEKLRVEFTALSDPGRTAAKAWDQRAAQLLVAKRWSRSKT
jgi:hypothetical protein